MNPIVTQTSKANRPSFAIPMPARRQTLMLTGFAAIGGGAALNWDWLTAVGAAPLLLSLAHVRFGAVHARRLWLRQKRSGGKAGRPDRLTLNQKEPT